MYILDTDHLSLIQRNGKEGRQILTRLTTIEDIEVAVTVITYEEQVRGRLSVLSRAKLDADSSKEYSQDFLNAFSKLVEEAGYTSISLQAPFLSKTKSDVVKLGAENLELIRSTWSCIHDSDAHCGMCEGCLSRRKAFEQAGIPDPAL